MIDETDIKQLERIFVTRQECESTNDDINNKLANDNKQLALIQQQLARVLWVGKTTRGAVLVALVGAVLTLILK